jgi:glycosyltransferase involved in cell wall biosynthesis
MGDICVLHTESSLRFGGQELRVILEMEKLAGCGIRSILLAPAASEILRMALGKGLEAYCMDFPRNLMLFRIVRICRLIISKNIAVITSHGSKDSWNAGVAALITRRPFIRSRHVGNRVKQGFFHRLIYGRIPKLTLTTSRYIADGIVNIGVSPGKIQVVPTGVDTEFFTPDNDGSIFRKEYGIPPEASLVGYVGVIRIDKGIPDLLRAFKAVKQKKEDAYLVLIGKGSQDDEVRSLLRELSLKGSAAHLGFMEDVRQPLSGLDVFVHPAIHPEGVPQGVLQAMSCGVPVIASDVGGVNEVAIDGRTALSVPPGEPAILEAAILKLLEDRNLALSLASQAREMVQSDFSLSWMLTKMTSIYYNLSKNIQDPSLE